MLKSDVITHFGNQSKVAKALGIGAAAVSKWGDRVPPLQAALLEELTAGALKFNPSEYADWYTAKRTKRAALESPEP